MTKVTHRRKGLFGLTVLEGYESTLMRKHGGKWQAWLLEQEAGSSHSQEHTQIRGKES